MKLVQKFDSTSERVTTRERGTIPGIVDMEILPPIKPGIDYRVMRDELDSIPGRTVLAGTGVCGWKTSANKGMLDLKPRVSVDDWLVEIGYA